MNFFFIAKLILFGGLILFSSLTLSIISKVDNQDSCKCSQSAKSVLLKVLCYMIIIIAAVNIFLPLNSLIAKLPLIGGLFSMTLLIILGLQMWLTYALFDDIKNCKECEISGYSANVMNVFIGFSYTFYIGAVILVTYGLLSL
jgi:hypothetical protein